MTIFRVIITCPQRTCDTMVQLQQPTTSLHSSLTLNSELSRKTPGTTFVWCAGYAHAHSCSHESISHESISDEIVVEPEEDRYITCSATHTPATHNRFWMSSWYAGYDTSPLRVAGSIVTRARQQRKVSARQTTNRTWCLVHKHRVVVLVVQYCTAVGGVVRM